MAELGCEVSRINHSVRNTKFSKTFDWFLDIRNLKHRTDFHFRTTKSDIMWKFCKKCQISVEFPSYIYKNIIVSQNINKG